MAAIEGSGTTVDQDVLEVEDPRKACRPRRGRTAIKAQRGKRGVRGFSSEGGRGASIRL